MDLQLIDKTALVTGSTAGIGLEIGRKLAVEGAKVIVTGRNQAKLYRAVETIRAGGHWQARFFGCNPHEDDLTQARRRAGNRESGRGCSKTIMWRAQQR